MSHLSNENTVNRSRKTNNLINHGAQNLASGQKPLRQTRKRSGCVNCRKKHKKCNEARPVCAKCQQRGEACEWDSGIIFRHTGLAAGHPSMRQATPGHHSQTTDLQIVHIAPKPLTPLARTQSLHPRRPEDGPGDLETEGGTSIEATCDSHAPTDLFQDPFPLGSPHSYHLSDAIPNSFLQAAALDTLPTDESSMSYSGLPSTSEDAQIDLLSGKMDSDELDVLDYLTSHHINLDFLDSEGSQSDLAISPRLTHHVSAALPRPELTRQSSTTESPDAHAMYYPTKQYKELHSTLHHHMVTTARNSMRTRSVSPHINQNDAVMDVSAGSATEQKILLLTKTTLKDLPPDRLSSSRHVELWTNYIQEIATWLDIFDCQRHFQTTIPVLAKSADHLHYSILALSARQLERRDPEKPFTESLGLYQEAIRLIVMELHTLDVAVIASCVLLCVLEMMSSSPKAWARHLDGCARLLTAAGINGNAGDVKQAIFWCFARMDCWGSFLGDVPTKIPTNLWFVPGPTMSFAVNHFKTMSGCDSYANYSVFLCASVVSVISTNHDMPGQRSRDNSPTSSYSARWRAMFRLLEDWYENRPPKMSPLMTRAPTSGETQAPFPLVLYANAAAINGNQLYHASTILMLQQRPRDVQLSKSHKSILWHARQICGIAVSNSHHGAWINALQPLWIAGMIMSHDSEHRAILTLLARIEEDSGWATAWRAQDLKDYWGLDSEH